VTKNGTIQSLNVSPKGFHEGFLLKNGNAVVQINLTKDDHGSEWTPGAEIMVEVEPEEPRGTPQHSVFRMVRLLDTSPGERERKADKSIKFSGQIERLNYALHGEINGGILDSGDFLHLKPEGARAVGLKAGMEVKGRGRLNPWWVAIS
jgi:hypothetical protein